MFYHVAVGKFFTDVTLRNLSQKEYVNTVEARKLTVRNYMEKGNQKLKHPFAAGNS